MSACARNVHDLGVLHLSQILASFKVFLNELILSEDCVWLNVLNDHHVKKKSAVIFDCMCRFMKEPLVKDKAGQTSYWNKKKILRT